MFPKILILQRYFFFTQEFLAWYSQTHGSQFKLAVINNNELIKIGSTYKNLKTSQDGSSWAFFRDTEKGGDGEGLGIMRC